MGNDISLQEKDPTIIKALPGYDSSITAVADSTYRSSFQLPGTCYLIFSVWLLSSL